jgi:DNA-binding CsgD family transcriptional regulator
MTELRKKGAKPHPEWDKRNVSFGGAMNERVHAIRSRNPAITKTEARMKVLAEHGFDAADSAIFYGIDESTVLNHHSKFMHKAGVGRDVLFRMIYMDPPV